MAGNVYVVHCVDTEGPLYEAPEVPFERLNDIFGIEITPSAENLRKLQNGEIPLNGKEEAVMNLLDSRKITTQGDWQKIDKILNEVMSKEYREILKDSAGNGWKFSWFCMDHVGFTGNNPRRRDAGFHKVYDHYKKILDSQNFGDTIQFHHHPVPFSGNYNESGTAFWGKSTLNEILAHDIIDRQWFPCAFRPGFHTERPDSNFFLEQWIPFDYANQSCKGLDTDQPDCSDGRFGDWRHAPLEWYPYHPHHDDYQKKGNCRRYITRCLNMYARLRMLKKEDVEDAFKQAEEWGGYFGIDIAKTPLEHAVQSYPELKIYNTNFSKNTEPFMLLDYDGSNIPSSDNLFDKIVCWGVFDACPQERILFELLRILKIGGKLLITGKNNNYLSDDKPAMDAEIGARKKGHPNYFTDFLNMKSQLESMGFCIVEEKRFQRRGDFVNDNPLLQIQDSFYEWFLIIEKTERSKLKEFEKFAEEYSKMFSKR